MGQTACKRHEAGAIHEALRTIQQHPGLCAARRQVIKLMLSVSIDAEIVFSVVVLNAMLGFVQEGKAASLLPHVQPAGVTGIIVPQPKAVAFCNAEPLDVLVGAVEDLFSGNK
jgi:hypothetical protein